MIYSELMISLSQNKTLQTKKTQVPQRFYLPIPFCQSNNGPYLPYPELKASLFPHKTLLNSNKPVNKKARQNRCTLTVPLTLFIELTCQ